jgi:hypothetical protein
VLSEAEEEEEAERVTGEGRDGDKTTGKDQGEIEFM